MISRFLFVGSLFLIFGLSLRAQIFDIPFQSKGALPKVIANTQPSATWPGAQSWYIYEGSLKEKRQKLVLSTFLRSGKVVFGHSSQIALQDFYNELHKAHPSVFPENEVYIVTSSQVGSFSSEKNLFITVGLLAKMDDPDLLTYFLLRAVNDAQLNLGVPEAYQRIERSADALRAILLRNVAMDAKIDEKTSADFLQIGGNSSTISHALNLIRYIDLPFAEKKVISSYFNSPLLYVPQDFFSTEPLNQSKSFEQANQSYRKEYADYKALIERQLPNADVSNTQFGVFPAFEGWLRDIRFQLAHDQIIDGQPEQALYSLFLLDQEWQESELSIWLKAHAWLHLSAQSYSYNPATYRNTILNGLNSNSQHFMRGLKKLNAFGINTLALRLVTDYYNRTNMPELKIDLEVVQENLISLMQHTGRFPADRLGDKPLVEALKVQDLRDSTGTRFDQYQQNVALDTQSFYLYALSDWVIHRDIISRINSKTKPLVLLPTHLDNSYIFEFDKEGNYLKEKSQIRTAEMHEHLESKRDVLKVAPFDSFQVPDFQTTDQYNNQAKWNRMLEERENFVPQLAFVVLASNSIRNGTSEKHLVAHFTHFFSLKPKGYHNLGFLILPLPFVIPDLLLGGNSTALNYFVWDSKTGEILMNDRDAYRDPSTGLMSGGKLLQTIQRLSTQSL